MISPQACRYLDPASRIRLQYSASILSRPARHFSASATNSVRIGSTHRVGANRFRTTSHSGLDVPFVTLPRTEYLLAPRRHVHEGLRKRLAGIDSNKDAPPSDSNVGEALETPVEKSLDGELRSKTTENEAAASLDTASVDPKPSSISGEPARIDQEYGREAANVSNPPANQDVKDLISRLISSSSRRRSTPPPRPTEMSTQADVKGKEELASSRETQTNTLASLLQHFSTSTGVSSPSLAEADGFGDSPMFEEGVTANTAIYASRQPDGEPESHAVETLTKNRRRNIKDYARRKRRNARLHALRESQGSLEALHDILAQGQHSGILEQKNVHDINASSTSKQVGSWINDFLSTLQKASPGGTPSQETISNAVNTQISQVQEVDSTADHGQSNESANHQTDLDLLIRKFPNPPKMEENRTASKTTKQSAKSQSKEKDKQSPLPVPSRKARLAAKALAKEDRKIRKIKDQIKPRKVVSPKAEKVATKKISDEHQREVAVDAQMAAPTKKRQSSKEKDPDSVSIKPNTLEFAPLQVEQPPTPKLAHNLDRVLFNRGVYNLQDRYSGVYNFDPYLEKIMPVADFDFNALRTYKTSSEDTTLADIARSNGLSYVGSTSSMTSMLSHFHYLISHWRELNIDSLSRGFKISDSVNSRNFTEIYKAPTAIFLRWKDGTYAIDADKEFTTPNVLMALGQSLEKLLTQSPSDFERFRKSDPREVPESERQAPESYHYSKQGNILMRSQLDAQDSRLPGTGVFDVKTRAVLPIRMSSRDHEGMTGYQILSEHGLYESYEREFYDMFRSTFLKYSLQVRMGRMEGIFIAYHNVEEIFGFQFMNLSDMDSVLHGQTDTCLGDQEFKASLEIVNKILDQATNEFPEKSIRLHFDTRSGVVPIMYIFAEPMEEHEIEAIQKSSNEAISDFERSLKGDNTSESTTDISESESSENASEVAAPSTSTSEGTTSTPGSTPSALHSATSTHRPLLAWTLTTSSTVNSRPVSRPQHLSPTDVWDLSYTLKRIPSPDRAWAFYERTKTRRKKALSFEDDAPSSAPSSPSPPSTSTPSSSSSDTTPPGDQKEGEISGMSLKDAMTRPSLSQSPSQSPTGPQSPAQGRQEEEEEEEEEDKSRRRGPSEHYIAFLRGMSERGKVLREERLKRAQGRKKVVVGFEGHDSGSAFRVGEGGTQEVDDGSQDARGEVGRGEVDRVGEMEVEGEGQKEMAGEEAERTEEEEVGTVEGYMAWLHRHQMEKQK
ncbi:mitochondrial protein Pet127-domain-containing protein [Elsinoe ampelina]|uniref:Mitochondrial protein Pet127-domain-containing protein n=1 Tax=Elsinoe ampelina TaxID=302913 RepID=A0A6A6GLN6_9PEZI|nr:mitochondrial protein Pet127-domain-containing protein [Elsinoe ampelina]